MKITVIDYLEKEPVLPAMFKSISGNIWLITHIEKIDNTAKGVMLCQNDGSTVSVGEYQDELELDRLTLLPKGTIVKFEQL